MQLDEEGFLASLEEVVANVNRLRQFQVDLKIEGDIKIKSPETGMHLFRIAQEALSNVTKHAKANHVAIDLSRTDGHLTMTISDDGVGLAGVKKDGKGIGMQTMNFRAKSMGGHVEVSRRAGRRHDRPLHRPDGMPGGNFLCRLKLKNRRCAWSSWKIIRCSASGFRTCSRARPTRKSAARRITSRMRCG